MALQSQDFLVLDGLSILNDQRPNPTQPFIASGVHLRWSFGPKRAFPLHGYYLFRRDYPDALQQCLASVMRGLPIGAVSGNVLTTAVGSISGANLLLTDEFGPPGTPEVSLSPQLGEQRLQGVRFDLPTGMSAVRVTLRIGFRSVRLDSPSDISVSAMRGNDSISTATAKGKSGEIITLELMADGITAVVIGAGPAALVDLCLQPTATDRPPGPWSRIGDFSYPLTLPISQIAYPASAGTEALSVQRSRAALRIKYGAAADAFSTQSPVAAAGLISLTPGSAIVAGEGTSWDESFVGQMLYPATIDTAFAIMTVLAPNRLVVSRPFTGPQPLSKVAYQLAAEDTFAQLHDQLAALLSEPSGMRRASMPPVLAVEPGTTTRGVLFAHGSKIVRGIGTGWTTSLEGLLLEIGPNSDVYRIAGVDVAKQEIALHREFVGATAPPLFPQRFRILSRSPNNRIEEPALSLSPIDLIELSAFSPALAQVLGLYWIDESAVPARSYDYMLLADHGGRFGRNVGAALGWLNGTPDFADNVVDGSLVHIIHAGSAALETPKALHALALPAGRLRSRPERPDLADSDPALSIRDLNSWKSRPAAQRPLMLEVWRAEHGPTMPPPGSIPNAQLYKSLNDRFLPTPRTTPPDSLRPRGWPDPAEVHYLDSGAEGFDVGWYSYRVVAIDAYGRYSPLLSPIPWHPVNGGAALHPYAVHLEDFTPPPPPTNVMAWVLEPDTVQDPMRISDAAYTEWRSRVNIGSSTVGLRVSWRWPWSNELKAPDLAEFRVYAQSTPLNARFHRVISVLPAPGNATRSLVTLAAADNLSNDAYARATLQVDERGYLIEGSRPGANLELRVKNGGPTGGDAPPSGGDATIVLPSELKPLHRDVFDPKNWERRFGAVAKVTPSNATLRFDIDPFEDPDVVLHSDPANPLRGNGAVFDRSKVMLPGPAISTVRPGIDVIALASDTTFEVFGIASIRHFTVGVPPFRRMEMNEVILEGPVSTSLPPGAYRWAIGPVNKGLCGKAARWTATSRTLSDLPQKIARIRPGVDMIHLRVDAASSPANIDHFFEIESVDAAQQKLVLRGATTLLTNGKQYDWRIGTPVRIYDAFFPDKDRSQPDDPQIGTAWLKPSLAEPVVYGTVGVSAVDKRKNEGSLASPATVFRVHREQPPAPADGVWDAERLLATRAGYDGNSYFSVRWFKPDAVNAPYYKALIFRCSRETLFQVDMEQNRAFPLTFPNTADDPRPTHWTASRKAGAEAKMFATGSQYALLRALPTLEAKLKEYRELGDDALSVLANLAGNEEAFAQITIDPLNLTPGASDDRRGPDDAAAYALRPTISAWLDTIPGRTQARYLYKIAYVDAAQNRGRLSKASPPVDVPKVVAPRSPVITKIIGGDKQITIHWAANREADLVGYRVYRADHDEDPADVRTMVLLEQLALGTSEPADRKDMAWTNSSVPAKRMFYFRVAALDSSGNESKPSDVVAGQAFDQTPPAAPKWISAVWQAGGKGVALVWSSDPSLRPLVQRRYLGAWLPASGLLSAGTNNYVDENAEEAGQNRYRLQVRNPAGTTNIVHSEIIVEPK